MSDRHDYFSKWIRAKHDIDHLIQDGKEKIVLHWPFETMAFKAFGIIIQMLHSLMRDKDQHELLVTAAKLMTTWVKIRKSPDDSALNKLFDDTIDWLKKCKEEG